MVTVASARSSQGFSEWSLCVFSPSLCELYLGTAVSPIIKTHAHQVKPPVSALEQGTGVEY